MHLHEDFMNMEASSGPGIRIQPPVIYLAAIAIGFALNYIWPLSGFLRYVIGSVVPLAGGLMMPLVLRRFRRAGTGIGILLNNGWILILVAPVFLVMDLWVVRREERHLEAKFGEEYLRYKAAVRRWL